MEAVVHVQPVRARAPRRRVLRARVGVLEDIFGPAQGPEADWLGAALTLLGNGLSEAECHEESLVRARGQAFYAAAHWRIRNTCSSRRAILRVR